MIYLALQIHSTLTTLSLILISKVGSVGAHQDDAEYLVCLTVPETQLEGKKCASHYTSFT